MEAPILAFANPLRVFLKKNKNLLLFPHMSESDFHELLIVRLRMQKPAEIVIFSKWKNFLWTYGVGHHRSLYAIYRLPILDPWAFEFFHWFTLLTIHCQNALIRLHLGIAQLDMGVDIGWTHWSLTILALSTFTCKSSLEWWSHLHSCYDWKVIY